MNQAQWMMSSKIGNLYLVASEKGLQKVFWQKQDVPMLESLNDSAVGKVLAQTAKQLAEYFAGQRKTFTLQLDTQGTEFQKKVWTELMKIPYGQTCSYSDIAQRINQPKAVRAVGTANGRNPISIIVPCHRVIAADRSLGGYSGGLPIKSQLLDLEKSSS